jgi:hypothetical protein
MEQTLIWHEGVDNYRVNTLITNSLTKIHQFTVELLDTPLPDQKRHLVEIFHDHLSNRQTKTVEVLYSGGMDSELVLRICILNKIPVRALTMRLMLRGYPINTHDLYYSEKFCRENNIEQKFVELDVANFFENGNHMTYLAPYFISEPHVATHMWLFEQSTGYPVLGGDYSWPWSHEPIISPHRLSYSSYNKFLKDRSIFGIGNMLGHSLESNCFLINAHQCIYDSSFHRGDDANIPIFKTDLFNSLGIGHFERRMKSYGWEGVRLAIFDKTKYSEEMRLNVGTHTSTVIWGETIANLLGGSPNKNSRF